MASHSAWTPYEPSPVAPWNLARVVHLHRRAGFAAPWDVLQGDLDDGPQAAIGRLLDSPTFDVSEFESMARTIGDAAMASGSPGRLQAWWMYRMLRAPDPLGERLALMWHNHFATSNRKVQDLVLMRQQNDLFRQYGRAPFGELLAAVVKHPAMLAWLDADANRKGHPNENLARELMELFTLGIGNYTEDDVKEASRALTGWTVAEGRFILREARHDDGIKSVLSHKGALTGDDLLELLLESPTTAERLAWRIGHTFLGEGVVHGSALAQLAAGLREHDLDIDWALETVLRSELFFSDANMRSRVAGPVELIVGSLRALELVDPPPSTLLVSEWATRMGQELFYPPNVGGWNEGRNWLASRTIVARANFAKALVDGDLWHPVRAPDFEQLARQHCESSELGDQVAWCARLLWGSATQTVITDVVDETGDMPKSNRLRSAVALLLARPENQLS
jgi:uncharacterized protein (DUF1800 family)